MGDSVTQGWMELGDNFNQYAYLDSLASRGINVLLLWSYIGISDQRADPRIGYETPAVWPWLRQVTTVDAEFSWQNKIMQWAKAALPWVKVEPRQAFVLSRFNEVYFTRLRALVQYANTKNIVVVITVNDGWTKTRFRGHPFNVRNGGPLTQNTQYVELADYEQEMPPDFDSTWDRREKHQYFLERFSERLIQATRDLPNVMYEIFNEGEWYDQKALRAFQVHFLRFFKARTNRITIVNDDHVGGEDFHGEKDADVISNHFPNWDEHTAAADVFSHYATRFAQSPPKPYFFTEPVPEYAGDSRFHDGLMRLMWGTVLGGASFVLQNDTSFGFDRRAAIAGYAARRDAVLDLEGHCARFFSMVDLNSMRPDDTLCSTRVCLTRPDSEYVIYSQSENAFTVDLSGSRTNFRARFYNPREGTFGRTFTVHGGSAKQLFEKPDSNDWVLHLRAAR
ncbi:MAG: putative collagen-binding domain-containing protein [Planctomycetota bacterium]